MPDMTVKLQDGTVIPEEFVQRARYELFKLYWLMSHGYSLQDLLAGLMELQKEAVDDTDSLEELQDPKQLMFLWEQDAGFDGELYPSFEEFLETDDKFMAENTMLYADYAKFISTVAKRLYREDKA